LTVCSARIIRKQIPEVPTSGFLAKKFSSRSFIELEQYNKSTSSSTLTGTMATVERQAMRDYQSQCLEKAKIENIIVHLGTGLGKTLIGLRLIEYYLNFYCRSKALILVPAVLLVEQHALNCRHQIDIGRPRRPPRVLEIVGSEQSGWNREDWERGLADHDIFIATADIFRKALINHKYISVEKFSVMVFDECHHATKGGSMASILHDAVHPFCDRGGNLPRLLGLTASFAKGKLDNAVKERQDLEVMFRGPMVSPEVEQERQQISEPMPVQIWYGTAEQNTDEQVKIIHDLLTQALQDVGHVKDFKKAIMASTLVFEELGRESLIYHVEYAIVKQIETKIAHLRGMNEEGPTRAAENMAKKLPMLRDTVDALKSQLLKNMNGLPPPPRSPKLERLIELLQERFSEHTNDGFLGVVFVKEISLVPTLAKQINDFLCDVKCGVVAGGNAQTMSERKENMDAFRRGDFRVLVATAALEEGVDVPECQFGILFSKYATAKSIIQILGRVRHKEAEHYFFENDPDTEMRKAERVVAVAQDATLSLTQEERMKAGMAMSGTACDKHPYPFAASDREQGGLVNIYNCKEIFVYYCARVLGRSINPPLEMYDFDVSGLAAVQFPSPESWSIISQAEVESFWEPVDVDSLFSSSRAKNLSRDDKIERLFVYVAVVTLRENGYLNMYNKPSKEAMARSKQNCPFRHSSPTCGITLKRTVTFDDNCREELAPVTFAELSLANSLAVLKNFVEIVLGRPISIIDDLFEYSASHLLMPTLIRFPTPGGWKIKTLHDVDVTFQDMSLGDQLDSDSVSSIEKTPREKMELGMAYLAVVELHDVGYLDDGYLPFLTPAALATTRKNCPLEISILTTERDVSVAQVSDMSVSSALISGPEVINTTENENGDMEIVSVSESSFSMISHPAGISVPTAEVCGAGQFDDADCDMSLY